jgi:hypothetical protein
MRFQAVLRIHDFLVRIRIRLQICGSVPLTHGSESGSGSCFSSVTFKMATKINFSSKFSAYYFLKLHLHHFSKIKSHKEVTKQ